MDIETIVRQTADGVAKLCFDKIQEVLSRPADNDLLTQKEAADFLHVSNTTIHEWKKQGLIKPIGTLGGNVYYSKSNLIKTIMSNN